ncbi:DUF3618 domain-containing protein [Mycolicibacterium sp. CR10]|uniref:DUF3618 domain-containing protein n=1 Tax=Mycolicibacterium sp. CR10 TaxID=2562314 RepID=UPI0010C02B3E|nr:DUF3618 domain-containing protein [Mycolicibacterium sp. CR10]
MASADNLPPEPGPDAGIDELKADIEKTRGQLGETVGALSDKMDVKARTQDKVHEVTDTVKAKPAVPAGVMIAVVAAVGLVWWWRRR